MNKIPQELLTQVLASTNNMSLKAARLTSEALKQNITPLLFSTVKIRYTSPGFIDMCAAESIAAHSVLRKHVSRVAVEDALSGKCIRLYECGRGNFDRQILINLANWAVDWETAGQGSNGGFVEPVDGSVEPLAML